MQLLPGLLYFMFSRILSGKTFCNESIHVLEVNLFLKTTYQVAEPLNTNSLLLATLVL